MAGIPKGFNPNRLWGMWEYIGEYLDRYDVPREGEYGKLGYPARIDFVVRSSYEKGYKRGEWVGFLKAALPLLFVTILRILGVI